MSQSAMTSRERLLATLRGDPVDRIAWSPCVDGYFLSSLPENQKLDEQELHKEVGSDAILRHVPLYASTAPATGGRAGNPRVESSVKSLGDGTLRFSYETKVGSLVEELRWDAMSPFTPWFVTRKLKTLEDIKIYMYALETMSVAPTSERFRSAVERLGEDGLVSADGPASPMEHLINSEMGLENFTYALADDPDTVEQCLALMHERNLEAYDILADSEAEVVVSYENLSTTLTSPTHYERYDQKHSNEYAAICRAGGKTYLTHMCGRLSGFAGPLSQADQDGFIDIAPAPTGDVVFGQAKASWARDKLLVGGIDATAFTSLSPEQMRVYALGRLIEIEEKAGSFHKFILGSGDALPSGTPVPVIRAVGEAVREYFG